MPAAASADGDRLPGQYGVGRGRRYEAILSGMASAVKRMSRICVRPARQVPANVRGAYIAGLPLSGVGECSS